MCIDHYQPGEVLRATDRPAASAAGSSFGRIARRRPAPIVDAAPLSIQLHVDARANRDRVTGDLVADAVHAIAALVRDLVAAWRQQRAVRGAVSARSSRDARTLIDLAVHRTEVPSVALGFPRNADDDRLRAAPAEHHPRLN